MFMYRPTNRHFIRVANNVIMITFYVNTKIQIHFQFFIWVFIVQDKHKSAIDVRIYSTKLFGPSRINMTTTIMPPNFLLVFFSFWVVFFEEIVQFWRDNDNIDEFHLKQYKNCSKIVSNAKQKNDNYKSSSGRNEHLIECGYDSHM